MMTLPNLPSELLLQISTEQSLPDINALLRTNRRLATLLRPALLGKLVRAGSHEYAERALHHFGERGDTRTVAWLLDRRILELTHADILKDILCARSESIMLTLLDAGLDPDVRCSSDHTLLMIAAQHGCASVVERLLAHEKGVNVNALDSFHGTALHNAIQCNQGEMAKMLLADPRVDLNSPDRTTSTPPLELAMSHDMVDLVAAIIRDPRIVIPPLDGENTWLHYAVPYGGKDTINLLLADPRINVNARNQDGMTAYMTAVTCLQPSSIYLLLKDERVDRSLDPEPEYLPMHLAARHGWPEVLRVLLAERAVDANPIYDGGTPLHVAIRFHQLEIVRMLVDDPRVDVNLRYVDELPLGLATASTSVRREIVMLLLSRDDVDFGTLNRGVPEGWDPILHKKVLGEVVGKTTLRLPWGGPCNIPITLMEEIRARGRHSTWDSEDDDDGW